MSANGHMGMSGIAVSIGNKMDPPPEKKQEKIYNKKIENRKKDN